MEQYEGLGARYASRYVTTRRVKRTEDQTTSQTEIASSLLRRVLDRIEAVGLEPQQIPGLQHVRRQRR